MRNMLAVVSGALMGVGTWGVLVGLIRVPVDDPLRRAPAWRRRRAARPPAALTPWRRWRWPAAAGGGLIAWAVSGWPAVGLVVAIMVVGLPVLLGTAKAVARAIDRVEGVEEWTRRLSDLLVTGIGLEQAITDSQRSCPAVIRSEVNALATRLSSRWPTETALRAFAEDLDDASGDLVACALILASRRRGPGLSGVLSSVADFVADDVAARRKIEAERAKPRATARAVTFITLGVVAVGSFNSDYLAPYATPLGQLVLAALTCAFVGCLVWMRSLTVTPPEPRFLTVSAESVEIGAGTHAEGRSR
ncbi:type II secretion system F family protein [Pengzhenrongella sp.]|jgi:Flp pilus assembly protein TadB|uniref:type II secretion system F family protein n=1 Tax=Pengzhenrongella sp. TaxID=2888820 RepID=UPI002F92FC40